MFGTKKIPFFLIPAFLLTALVASRIFWDDKYEEISRRVFDRYQTLKPRIYKDTPVRFVDIDDESLAKYGQWPWPRTLLSELVNKLSQEGASAIVMDILFAETDRTSPSNVLPLWKSDLLELKTLKEKVNTLPDHDQIFAQAFSQANIVTGFNLTREDNGKKPFVKAGFAHSGEDPLHFLPAFQGTIPNLEILEKNASGNGSFNFIADSDGVLRRVPILMRYKDQLVPSLVAEALRTAQGASSYVVKSSGASSETSFGNSTGIISVKIGNFIVPTDSDGRIWLYDTGKIQKRYLPAWKVLSDEADPSLMEGNIIFLGSSAAGLKDLRTTPLNPVAAGTEVHVQLTEQILNEDFLVRPDWAFGAEIIFLVLVGLCLIFFLPSMGAALSAIFSLLMIGLAIGFSWKVFIDKHWLLDPVTPSVTCLIVYLCVSLMNYLRTEAEKKQIRGAFGQYVSPALLEQISAHPEKLKLGGEIKPMTVLFSDIRNFTTLSEQMTAEELTGFMNRYLTPMTDLIMKAQGTIDKYIGDCIMAFWNAPLEDPNHARHACEAALSMQSFLKEWNAQMVKEAQGAGKNFQPIAIGIGINTGSCCVGNMGSDQRFDYSVLGDDVNLASRLESQCKVYHTGIILGQNTREAVGDFAALELDVIQVKGKNKPVTLFALLGDSQLNQNPKFKKAEELHKEWLAAVRRKNTQKAQELLSLLKETEILSALKNFYLKN